MYNYYNSTNIEVHNLDSLHNPPDRITDFGPNPCVTDINRAVRYNNMFRTALWTGSHMQLTLMCINAGEDIGLECHPDTDQFIRIEEGQGLMKMGDSKDHLYLQQPVYDGFLITVPAGTWHNLLNTGSKPLKLYSVYAPSHHPWGTVHTTKKDEEAAENHGDFL